MGTKKPAAAGPAKKQPRREKEAGAELAASKRPRAVEGADITRFFDIRRDAGEPQGHHQNNQQQQGAGDGAPGGGRSVSPLGGGAGAPNATEHTPGAGTARPALHKHLSMLQDMGPADSFAMSQDTDAMQVVWQDSPGSSSRPQGRSLSNLGGRGGGSGAQEIKQRLISAAQRPRDVRRPPGGGAFAGGGGGARLQQGEQLLEGLLAGRPQAGAVPQGAAAPAAAAPAAPERSAASGAPSEPSGGVGGASHRTPGTHLRGILKRSAAGAGSAGRHTPASTVKFRAGSSGRRVLASSGKKRSAGQKRKALLELLEQVESFVHSSASPEGGEGGCAAGGDAEADGGAAAAVATAAAVAAAAADEAGAVNEKENVVGGGAGGKPVRVSQGQAGGPTGSQQLMPPPAARPPPAAEAQHPLAPLAQAPAGPEEHEAAHAAPPAQPSAVAAAAGGFGYDDDDEDDALMAQLELELLTQVEQRHAGKQAAAGRAGPARQGHVAPPAALPRPQAAPPAAQHPAAAAVQQQGVQQRGPVPGAAPRHIPPAPQQAPQQQQQQAASRQHTPAPQEAHPEQQRQPGGPPRSPYDRALPPAAAAVAPAAAEAADLPPTQPAGAAEAEVQGSDSGWEDDFDGELLDQFEAAALKERASGGASGGGAPAVAEGGVPPGGQAAPAPRFPGSREQVYYTITEVYPPGDKQVLRLHNKYQNRDVYAHLKAPWCDLPFRVGDPVNLLARLDFFEGHHHCLLDMEQGMLILHPDVLLSGTRITTSHECTRRSFLDERVAESGGSNDKAVKGTLTHNLIQAALTEGLRTPPQLVAAAERVVGEATEALLEVELTEEAALECLRQAMPGIQRWMHRFLWAEPAPDSLLAAGMDYSNGREVRRAVAVPEVVDIEESIWSTKFGVKGMIDVSARLALQDPSQQPRQGGPGGGWMQAAASSGSGAPGGGPGRELAIGPIEIKTGKPHGSHHAQVLLYLLLMEERYGRPLDWGMLWYTGQPDPQLIMKRPTDLACLLAVRNRLAAAIAHREMPPLTDEKRQCNWCFQQANCMLAYAAQRGVTAATPDSFVRPFGDRGAPLDNVQQELAGKYERSAGHMTDADCQFLRKWEALVTLEEGHSTARRPEVWAMAGEERQALGRCVAGLELAHVDEEQLLYTFCRPGGAAIECGFTEGEMLLLSVEGQHAAVARGYFYTCSATHLTVSLNKALRRGLLQPGATPAEGAAPSAGPAGGAGAPRWDASVRWRLDRDEVASTFVRLRGNLFALFRRDYALLRDPKTNRAVQGEELPSSLQAARLRQLVVGLEAPRYAPPDPTQPDPTPAGMNSEQAAAVRRVASAQDYTLVLGMPGAGKTTTIVSMVQALVSQGKSVLLTSYTNSAVDNILMKLAKEEVPFVRLGRESGVHPAVRPWLPGGERYQTRTTRELAELSRVPVFGATCFGVHHPLIKRRMFDVCIIDEAGQMMLPAALGPLLRARSFVLVGDHNQLPPLVTCKEAEAGGLGESLFKRLSEAHPQAVVSLPVQYRMAADIMLLPNQLIYNNQLRCGTDGIAQAVLQLSPGAAATLAGQPAWLQAALDPQRRVLFLDTSAVEGARESVSGDAVSNPGEARLMVRMLAAAVAAGVPPGELGVISPYRSQVALLDRQAREARLEGVEALTVDKCQGRDKEAILLSLVRSNAEGEAGKLLTDWRRINVAITRAKCKLVLVGDAATLASIDLFARLVALVRQQGWYMPLPADALAQ